MKVTMKKKLKIALGFIILIATVAVFAHYIATNPGLIKKLGDVNPLLVVLLTVLYLVWFAALALILRVSLWMFNKTMPLRDNLLLNAYSNLINFFGPGQNGPAVRAVYLKKRHGLRIKDYMFTTLLYYGFYAVISALFMFVGSRPWWQTLAVVLAAGGGSAVVIRWYAKRSAVKSNPGMNIRNIGLLLALTSVQLLVQLAIYYIELLSIDSSTTFAQALTYTGVANFSLFVALTPGAIGIREAFLVFSQQLHNISNSIIVAANLIDRAVYLVFLGVLFIMSLSLHAKSKLKLKSLQQEAAKADL